MEVTHKLMIITTFKNSAPRSLGVRISRFISVNMVKGIPVLSMSDNDAPLLCQGTASVFLSLTYPPSVRCFIFLQLYLIYTLRKFCFNSLILQGTRKKLGHSGRDLRGPCLWKKYYQPLHVSYDNVSIHELV